jgi:para-aminobenzoate synthetase component I
MAPASVEKSEYRANPRPAGRIADARREIASTMLDLMTPADAIATLVARGTAPEAAWLDGGPRGRGVFGAFPDEAVEGDDLGLLDDVEARWRRDPEPVWIGWLSYDLGAGSLLGRPPRASRLPGLCLRRYPAVLELQKDRATEHGHPAALADLRGALAHGGRHPLRQWPWTGLRPRIEPETYRARVDRVLEHVRAGDTYQVNIAQAFEASWLARPQDGIAAAVAGAYALLRQRAPASMGALVGHPGRAAWVVSNSPETLLDVRFGQAEGGRDLVRSSPIKGTRRRAAEATIDAALRRELQRSSKDAAEHVMIVDLVRNDLGRVAFPGTVTADPVPRIVTLPTVHHLVTEVRAALRPGVSLRELVEATFPGGSITGAPKHRTVEIIDALEGEPRGIYCGALVLLEPTGLRMSIAIRTATVDASGLVLPAGGGIVADSDPESERLETITKTRAFAPNPSED